MVEVFGVVADHGADTSKFQDEIAVVGAIEVVEVKRAARHACRCQWRRSRGTTWRWFFSFVGAAESGGKPVQRCRLRDTPVSTTEEKAPCCCSGERDDG